MMHFRTVVCVIAFGTALTGSSYLWANPPIERAQPTFIGSSGGPSASGLSQADLDQLQQSLADQFVSQDLVIQLSARLQRMEEEMQQLRDANEQLQEQLRRIEQDGRDRYIELDRRLRADSGAAPSSAPALGQADAADEQMATRAYRAARDLMTERRYDDAASGFEQFIADFPQSELLADAWFWLGEVRLLLRDNAQAEAAYQRVLSDFPASDKRADALFKLGFLAERQGQSAQARDFYQQVLDESNNGSLADLARQRLQGL